jgi:micrococcal nuclease
MRFLILIAFISLVTNSAQAETAFSAYDGDTFYLNRPQTECLQKGKVPAEHQKIRVFGVDAPEKKQPYGLEARNYLWKMIQGRDLALNCKGCTFDRKVCRVTILLTSTKWLDISREMAGRGYAFDSVSFSKGEFSDAEAFARKLKRGVWKQPGGGVRPWAARPKKKKPLAGH